MAIALHERAELNEFPHNVSESVKSISITDRQTIRKKQEVRRHRLRSPTALAGGRRHRYVRHARVPPVTVRRGRRGTTVSCSAFCFHGRGDADGSRGTAIDGARRGHTPSARVLIARSTPARDGGSRWTVVVFFSCGLETNMRTKQTMTATLRGDRRWETVSTKN